MAVSPANVLESGFRILPWEGKVSTVRSPFGGPELGSKSLGQAGSHRQEQKATLEELTKICTSSKKRLRRRRDPQRSGEV